MHDPMIEVGLRLRSAKQVVVFTGAGVSAESGVPTFRDAQTGLWAQFKAEELATPEAFQANPKRVWEWYAWRRELVGKALPNPAHRAIAEIERHVSEFTLVTQNVDGLHQRAGSQRVIELHGNIRRVKCFEEGVVVEHWQETGEVPPRCPACGAWLRPDVVWFGEALPDGAFEAAVAAAEACDLCFSIGTAAAVYPAASLPAMAKAAGAFVVEIDPNRTALSGVVDACLPGPAGTVLPAVVRAAWPES
jgi:NAD-dependent deacetylase